MGRRSARVFTAVGRREDARRRAWSREVFFLSGHAHVVAGRDDERSGQRHQEAPAPRDGRVDVCRRRRACPQGSVGQDWERARPQVWRRGGSEIPVGCGKWPVQRSQVLLRRWRRRGMGATRRRVCAAALVSAHMMEMTLVPEATPSWAFEARRRLTLVIARGSAPEFITSKGTPLCGGRRGGGRKGLGRRKQRQWLVSDRTRVWGIARRRRKTQRGPRNPLDRTRVACHVGKLLACGSCCSARTVVVKAVTDVAGETMPVPALGGTELVVNDTPLQGEDGGRRLGGRGAGSGGGGGGGGRGGRGGVGSGGGSGGGGLGGLGGGSGGDGCGAGGGGLGAGGGGDADAVADLQLAKEFFEAGPPVVDVPTGHGVHAA